MVNKRDKIKFKILFRFLAAGIVIISVSFLNSCGRSTKDKDTKNQESKTEKTQVKLEESVKLDAEIIDDLNVLYTPTDDHLGKAIKGYESLGVFEKYQLKDSTDLLVLSNGFEKQLVDFIESDKPADKKSWFNLRRVVFEGNSSKIDKRSDSQINNVSKILKLYPNIELRLGGYTNDTYEPFERAEIGSARRRAKALLNALVIKGVDVRRLTSEGYGTEHPISDDITEEGRALNRRVAARVSKK